MRIIYLMLSGKKIGNLNIRSVTQQYVKGDNNEYYLIDLYFPQINVGVEVDEAFHKKITGWDTDVSIKERIEKMDILRLTIST